MTGESDPIQTARRRSEENARQYLAEIAALARQDCELPEYWPKLLAKICETLGAPGGMAWNLVDGQWQLAGHIGRIPPELTGEGASGAPSPRAANPAAAASPGEVSLDEVPSEKDFPREEWGEPLPSPLERHQRMLTKARQEAEPGVLPPRIGDGRNDEHDNPTEFRVVLCPVGATPEFHGLIEIFIRAGSPAQAPHLVSLVGSACLLANEFLQSRHYRALTQRERLWADWDRFLLRIHDSLDPARVAFETSNEVRRLLGCDRVSVSLQRRGRQRLTSVSGQESVDRRATPVQRLEKLAQQVIATGEPLWYTGVPNGVSPQILATLNEYLDAAQVHSLAVVPLTTTKPQSDDEAPARVIIGALICESFGKRDFDAGTRRNLDVLTPPASQALANALVHDELFLMPLWRTLGKSRVLLSARNWPRTRLALAAIGVLLLTLLVVPGRFELEGRGELQPVVRHEVFAGVDGEVTSVRVAHGESVQEGDILCVLQNPDLDVQRQAVEGQRNSALKKFHATQRALLGENELNSYERTKLSGELLQLQAELASLQRQVELLDQKQARLTVRSPIAGQVVTWDAEDHLIHRPVKRGDVLLHVIQPDAEWELEVRVPESRLGYIAAARETLGPERPVRFVLATDPRRKLTGALTDVHRRAEVRGEDGNTVLARVAIDQREIPHPRPGAEVTARIDCGRRPLGFCWLHDLFDWTSKMFFRLF